LVGFEPTIPALERAKTVHALDGAATVIGGPFCSLANTTFLVLNATQLIIQLVN
jgi:hypothetical protein